MSENIENSNANGTEVVLAGSVNYGKIISSLTPEQKEQYLQLCSSVDISDGTSLQVLGTDIVEANTRTTDTVLSSVRSSDHEIVKQCLVDTIKQLHMVNPKELDPDNQWRNFALKIPILKNIVHTVDGMQIMAKTAEQNVNEIFDRMKASTTNLTTNNSTLEQMYIEGNGLIEAMNGLIVGLKLRKDVEVEKLNEMQEDESTNPWDTQKQKDFITRIEQEILNKEASVQDMMQGQMMICTLQSTNDKLVNACGVVINQTLPQWKKAIALAIQADETRQVLQTVNIINEKLNEVTQSTAKAVANTAIEAAKDSHNTSERIKALEESQKIMFDAMRTVKRTIESQKNNFEATESRLEALQENRKREMKAITQK